MSTIDHEAMNWFAKRSGGRLSRSEEADFIKWYNANTRHQGAYLRAQAIWHTLDQASVLSELGDISTSVDTGAAAPQDVGAEIPVRQIPIKPGLRANQNRRNFFLTGIAAGVAAAGTVGLHFLSRTTLKTSQGEFRKVPLPDHSIANINSASHVEVSMSSNLRRVTLIEGEAWFEVAKNPERPFVVEAGSIRVRALGTAFSVRRGEKGADVMVTEGVVEAWNENDSGERRQIGMGQEAYIAETTNLIKVSSSSLAEIDRKLAWREGNIVLQDETLEDAVVEFNRYNTQKIIVVDPSLAGTRFVGRYRIDRPESFAAAIHTLLKVPTRTQGDTIIIGTEAQSHDAT